VVTLTFIVSYVPVIQDVDDDFVQMYQAGAEQRAFNLDGVILFTGSEKSPDLQCYHNGQFGFKDIRPDNSDQKLFDNIPDIYNDSLNPMLSHFRDVMTSPEKSNELDITYRVRLFDRCCDHRKGVVSGIDSTFMSAAMSVDAPDLDVPFAVRCEGAFFRALLQESDSRTRLQVLLIWCWIVSKLGLQTSALDVMCSAHEVGKAMMTVQCHTNSTLAEYYRRHRSRSELLNSTWDMVMEHVFSVRHLLEPFARDALVCQFHPPYLCPHADYVEVHDEFNAGVVSDIRLADEERALGGTGDMKRLKVRKSVNGGEAAVSRLASILHTTNIVKQHTTLRLDDTGSDVSDVDELVTAIEM
jgi:hypothetical protein